MSSYRRSRGGYTIIEVVIVLTVSALLFASSAVAYNQQNQRTQFTSSVNNFAQSLQDVLNDVENGFYPSRSDFKCSLSGVYPDPNQSGAVQQGSNTDCIFLGKAIQFAPSGTNGEAMDIYTVVGRRLVNGTDTPVTSVDDAYSVALNELVERKELISGLQIYRVSTAAHVNLSGVAIVSNSGGVSSGLNARASLAAINGGINQLSNTFTNRIKTPGIRTSNINAATGGINICVREGGGGRTAVIALASGSSQTIVDTKVDTPCP